jgi:hypothetical protein
MEMISVWLPPAAIIGVILFTSNLTNKRMDDLKTSLNKRMDDLGTGLNKRIDDLREQMKTDHQNLANQLVGVEDKLDEHITNYSIHSMKGD